MRYIDADKIIWGNYNVETFNGTEAIDIAFKSEIDAQPTEDVVPRAEVEEIVKFKDMSYAELKSYFVEAKQEVAREIFEYLECLFCPVYEYTGDTIKEYIAELKKKYIGE